MQNLNTRPATRKVGQLAGMRRFNCTASTVVKLMNVEVTA